MEEQQDNGDNQKRSSFLAEFEELADMMKKAELKEESDDGELAMPISEDDGEGQEEDEDDSLFSVGKRPDSFEEEAPPPQWQPEQEPSESDHQLPPQEQTMGYDDSQPQQPPQWQQDEQQPPQQMDEQGEYDSPGADPEEEGPEPEPGVKKRKLKWQPYKI